MHKFEGIRASHYPKLSCIKTLRMSEANEHGKNLISIEKMEYKFGYLPVK